ncbi:unnamed protein product [Schistosoma curassoni]|nr:unnamed protein product [Schistosoma curassoni]
MELLILMFASFKNVTPKFSFKFYGYNVKRFEIYSYDDFIAVKWYFRMLRDGTIAKITSVIHSNGKISLYYENIPTGQTEGPVTSIIEGVIQCEDVRKVEIVTPRRWITSDTLVEFEHYEISCSIHDSIEKCQNATTSSVQCIWSEKANMCINSDDNDVKNTTSEITVHNKHNNTPRYLYIVIPVVVVVAFCVICIGCAIWMYKRKKSNP